MASTLTLHATGPVAPAEAWERYALPRRWSEWSPHILGADASAPRIAPGVTGRVHGPLAVRVPFTVLQVDGAARSWTWEVQAGPVRLTLEHWVAGAPGGGSTTGLRMRGPLPVLAGYTPLAQLALHRLVTMDPGRPGTPAEPPPGPQAYG
ncbi:SRPBCC family protein [Modestobacter sp. I12A-02628]|uniref:SRPBCC family protein n=1 Tax=Goekera deserti TaxID=2497753 RepID=A0A7K3WFN3_9ACTN|nr:SRPBCC family protein [Goekera deserti]MPR00061.1 SRPBCC family protein [Goekera deserti]NDI49840.1 SRPBCC family protein [Goekera deserti]NEL55202.1 SRPBCC family protein [Goekera deserti]